MEDKHHSQSSEEPSDNIVSCTTAMLSLFRVWFLQFLNKINYWEINLKLLISEMNQTNRKAMFCIFCNTLCIKPLDADGNPVKPLAVHVGVVMPATDTCLAVYVRVVTPVKLSSLWSLRACDWIKWVVALRLSVAVFDKSNNLLEQRKN